TNPSAKNYNPAADTDDGSCIYLAKVGDNCYEFQDVQDIVDESYTISFHYGDDVKMWSFYHDYIPNYYIHTREQVYALHANKMYKVNAGKRGIYFGELDENNNPIIHPFYIDMVFAADKNMILNAVKWTSEVQHTGVGEVDDPFQAVYFKTISAITIWNNYQCSGRIELTPQLLEKLNDRNNRNSEQTWSFNDFRNILVEEGVPFLDTIFNDYAIQPGAVNTELPWYERRLMEGNYFIIRFEFDN